MRTTLVVCAATLLLAFAGTATAQVMQTGKFSVDRTVANYSLDQGNGDRTVTVEVNFEKPFTEKPVVALSVTTIDASKDANTRFEVKTLTVSRDGFVIQVRTWADTKIHALGGSWVAYAAK
jgi:hypothetical protein